MVSGLGLVIAAKISGTALAARLFQLTQPALMKLAWFARLYTPWKIWKDRVLAQARSSRLWLQMKQLKLRMRALASRPSFYWAMGGVTGCPSMRGLMWRRSVCRKAL